MQQYYKGENLQSIITFCEVIKQRSVTKAARAMNITQPAVSKQIAALERQLGGVKLFVKNGRNFDPTESGLTFYYEALESVQNFRSINARFFEKENSKNDAIRISGHHYPMTQIVPQTLGRLRQMPEFKDRRFTLYNQNREEAMELLKNGELDICIYPITLGEIEDHPNIKHHKLLRYEPVLVLWKGHPLAKLKDEEINMDMIFNQDLILGIKNFVSKKYIRGQIIKANSRWIISIDVVNIDVVLSSISNKLGITILHKDLMKNCKYKSLILKDASSYFPETWFMMSYQENCDRYEKYKDILDEIIKTVDDL